MNFAQTPEQVSIRQVLDGLASGQPDGHECRVALRRRLALRRGIQRGEVPRGRSGLSTWRSAGRTITESDSRGFVNLSWFHEDIFTNRHDQIGIAIAGCPVPLAPGDVVVVYRPQRLLKLRNNQSGS